MTDLAEARSARPPSFSIPYAVILMLGTLLWWGSAFHASAMPQWAPWDFSWSWFLATALLVFWYGRGLFRSTPDARPALWRILLFYLGVLLIWSVLQTHFEYLAEHMFFVNRVQHLVMHHLGPFLIALAWPWPVLARGMPDRLRLLGRARALRVMLAIIQQPFLAAVLFVGLIALWLWPPVHFVAMIDPRLYAVMNWSMVVDGVLFWSLVLDPRPKPPAFAGFGARAAIAVLVMFPQIAIGASITFANRDLYSFYAWCGRVFPSIGALDDQKFGGLIVWIPAAMMSVIALILVINALRLADENNRSDVDEDDDETGVVVSSKGWTG